MAMHVYVWFMARCFAIGLLSIQLASVAALPLSADKPGSPRQPRGSVPIGCQQGYFLDGYDEYNQLLPDAQCRPCPGETFNTADNNKSIKCAACRDTCDTGRGEEQTQRCTPVSDRVCACREGYMEARAEPELICIKSPKPLPCNDSKCLPDPGVTQASTENDSTQTLAIVMGVILGVVLFAVSTYCVVTRYKKRRRHARGTEHNGHPTGQAAECKVSLKATPLKPGPVANGQTVTRGSEEVDNIRNEARGTEEVTTTNQHSSQNIKMGNGVSSNPPTAEPEATPPGPPAQVDTLPAPPPDGATSQCEGSHETSTKMQQDGASVEANPPSVTFDLSDDDQGSALGESAPLLGVPSNTLAKNDPNSSLKPLLSEEQTRPVQINYYQISGPTSITQQHTSLTHNDHSHVNLVHNVVNQLNFVKVIAEDEYKNLKDSKHVFYRKFKELLDNITVDIEFLAGLVSKEVITSNQHDKIMQVINTASDKVALLLGYVSRKGIDNLVLFLIELFNTKQAHVVKIITQGLQEQMDEGQNRDLDIIKEKLAELKQDAVLMCIKEPMS